ncbi:unnamed protein product [Heterobilharzia americana]|nr:unnamed protein product [Heterobilharzia americana]CAH8468986.1 unnamed protein product [Heterobilharzia americana]
MVTPIGKYSLENSCDADLDKDIDDDDEISLSSEDEIKSNNILDKKNNSQSLWFRAQKRLVGRVMRNQQSVKSIIGNRAYKALTSLHTLMKMYIKPESEVKQLYKSLVKTIGKIGVISQQRSLSDEDYTNIHEIKDKSCTIGLTLISFAQTEYTYNYAFLKEQLDNCKDNICQAVTPYLSQKSVERIKYLFNVLSSSEFLDSVYNQSASETQKAELHNLVNHLNQLVCRTK